MTAISAASHCSTCRDPSLLEFQRRFQRTIQSNNLSTVFGVEQIQAAIELPAKWQAYGEALFDLFGDTDFERLQDVYCRQTNRIMERVLRYFPMRRIRGASKSLADEVQGELDGRSPFRRSFVGRGFTHARQHLRGRQPALWLDATAVGLAAVDRQEHYVTHAELVTDLNAIFDSHDVREAVIQRYGKRYHDSLMRYIERIANPDIYQAHDPLIQLMDQLSVNFTIGTLAFKIPDSSPADDRCGGLSTRGWPGQADQCDTTRAPAQSARAARLRTRARPASRPIAAMDPFVAELKSLTRTQQSARIYRRVVQVNGTIGMFILKALDNWSVLVGWKAVYDNVYAKTRKEAEAIEAARRATIRTQPSGRAKDLPELYVNRAMRWFLIFTTPINRFRNMLAWAVPRDIRNRRVGHALVTLAALFSIAAIEEIIRTWRVPDEPEEAKKFALRFTSRFADWTPIFTNLAIFISTWPGDCAEALFYFVFAPSSTP